LLESFGMTLIPLPISAAVPTAKAFAIYLERLKKDGRTTLNRVPLPDFLIGAHAEAEGMKLVTRDPDRVRTYFPAVQLSVPPTV
jgi:predicted nucleic acid-binding protein